MKLFRRCILGLLLLSSGLVFAQSAILNGTVTDSDTIVWANGTWSLTFVPNPSQPNINSYTLNGSPLNQAVLFQNGALSGTGTFSVTTYANGDITPSGSKFQLQFCPNASSGCGQLILTTVNGTTNVSSLITPAITAPRFKAVSGTYGYADVEAQTQQAVGATYYNVTSSCQRIWSGTAWSCSSGGTTYPGVTSNGNGLNATGAFIANGVQDTSSLTIPAQLMSGADPCEQISNAFGVIRSLRSGMVNACALAINGYITCSSDPFASIQTAYTDFGGKLNTCQAAFIPATTLPGGASGNTLLPWKIPNAIEFDGGSSHPLASPTYPAPRGTTFQPAPSTPPYKGPIIALGGYNVTSPNYNPMGVKLKNFAVSCLAPGTTYTTTTVNITSWVIAGASYPYQGTFTYSGAPNQVAQWDVLSLANFGTTTAFNGPFGKHMVVTSVTGNTFTANINILPGSATEAGNAIVSMGTTAVINEDAQEGSGIDTFSVAGCTTAYAIDVDPNNGIGGVASSGFDSQGAHGGMITMPADPSAVCFKIGGTAEGQLISFPANIENISGNSCQGTLSGGVATGTFAAIEGQNVYFGLNRMAYLDGLIHAGFIKSTNTITFVNSVDSFSNVSYPWTNLFWFGPKVGHTINIMGGGGLGTAAANAVTLFDFNYPTGPCTLLASNEASIGLYSRGIGGGGNGSVVSTARTGCVGTPPAGMASTLTGNTFGFITNFASSAHMVPTGTATGGGNFGSNTFAIDSSYWNGSAAVTVSATVSCGVGSGATPNLTCNLAPPATAPALRVLTLATGGAVPWDIIDFGASAVTTTYRMRGTIQMFNLAGTFHADFVQPTLTGSRTYTLQDVSGTVPLTIASGSGAAMTTALIAAAPACGATVTIAAVGTLTTDTINWAFNAAVGSNPGSLIVNRWPTAGNVNFQYCNPTAAGITPTAASINWKVIR